MPEEECLRLRAIAERIMLVDGWLEGMSEADFLADLMARDAAAMSLLVIGETARRLTDTTKAQAGEIPWSAIISLRNRLAHGYEAVDHRLVWQIVRQDMPNLAKAVNRLLSLGGAAPIGRRASADQC